MRKKIIVSLVALTVIAVFAFKGRTLVVESFAGKYLVGKSPVGKSLVGRWKATYGNQMSGHLILRSNGTYDADFDGQSWKVGGHYKVQGSTVTISDSVCGFGYWGKYQCTWYSDDSVRETVLTDSCSGRKGNADGMVLVRDKN